MFSFGCLDVIVFFICCSYNTKINTNKYSQFVLLQLIVHVCEHYQLWSCLMRIKLSPVIQMMNSVIEITPYSETDSLLKLLVIIIIMTSRQVFMQMNDAAVSLTVLVMNS